MRNGLAAVAVFMWLAAGALTPAASDPHGAIARGADGASSPPERLSETGLYDDHGAIARDNLPFSPQYPLWSDGAVKHRWIHLPAGTRIDVSDIDAWRFPVGTKLWKEFAWNGRKVETRMLWKAAGDRWIFASYQWNEKETDALLAPAEGVRDVVEVAPGKQHSIPAIADCGACHLTSPSVVLGFNALQLSDDRDPLAPHAEPLPPGAATLRTLVERDELDPARPDLVRTPPGIRAGSPTERAALGYLSANCGGCHHASGPLADLGLDLRHEVSAEGTGAESALASAVDVPGRYVVPGISVDRSRRVAPGAPERSALLYRMRSRRPSSQMPPLGTVVPDTVAIDLVTRWISALGPGPANSRPLSAGSERRIDGHIDGRDDRGMVARSEVGEHRRVQRP